MSNTEKIKFQIDLAIKIQDRIEANTDKVAPVLADVIKVLQFYGVTSDYAFHTWSHEIYDELGFDYDEVEGL